MFMKKIPILTFLMVSLASVQAQGTMQFTVNLNGANEVPPNSSPGSGFGTFTLSGTDLSYDFSGTLSFQGGSEPTDGTINGPVNAGSAAPLLFDLGAPLIGVPNPPSPGSYGFQGTINSLTGTQISDLENGLWYVNVFTSSSTYPGGEIRGQITPVPEPSALALLGLGAGLTRWFKRDKS